MKLIFLDIDGVLNSRDYFESERYKRAQEGDPRPYQTVEAQLDDEAVERLQRLVLATGAAVVVSSTWRLSHPLPVLNQLLRRKGFFSAAAIGATPQFVNRPRGEEILEWLRCLNIEPTIFRWWEHAPPFVILDDDSDMDPLEKRLVQTSMQTGLLDEHVERAIALLGPR